MKWKIRFMFETTNQPWECRLKLNSEMPLDGETPDERIFKMHKIRKRTGAPSLFSTFQ